jgi:hypothetical protein
MSFMADYGDDEEFTGWAKEAKQRWGAVAIFLVVAVVAKILFF